jgi:hypothetical protein
MADSRCWTKEFVTDFINLYMQMPCLWRIKSRDYTNKNLKNEAYDKLVEFCKPVFPDANRDFVYKKIQSLRASFRKELKKFLDSKRSGTVADEVYQPTLWYFDLLLFTMDQEIPSQSISNIEEEPCVLITDYDVGDSATLPAVCQEANEEQENQV